MSSDCPRRIALLGATGSVGTSCLHVLRAHPQKLALHAVTAHSRWEDLAAICREFHPALAVLTGVQPGDVPAGAFPASTQLRFGMDALMQGVSTPDVDIVVAAIVGAAGLWGTWAAIQAGKQIALANKETMVVAGPLVTALATSTGSKIIPVDSEHSAIFQALQCGCEDEVARLVLTASGGPFRTWSAEKLADVSVEHALAHPTWEMGPKITIDSATMTNKALELVEARWLFNIPADRLEVAVHPQSIVHSFVEFVDGSVLAQLSPPDMCLPIQYALSWPRRWEGVSPRMDWTRQWQLEFAPPDPQRFPAVAMGFEVARNGGSAGAVFNAANEVAVDRFLNRQISFLDISRLTRSILNAHQFDAQPTLDGVLAQDRWARTEATRWTSQ